MSRPLAGVILAAGMGTRMKSSRPKVLHEVCGRPLLRWVLDAVAATGPDEIFVVVGHGAEQVEDVIARTPLGVPVRTVVQESQRGTGDAARVALGALEPAARDLIVLPGDMPLVRPSTLQAMLELHRKDDTAVTLLTTHLADPTGYGRVIRHMGGEVARIVEEADCTPDQAAIDEVAVSTYVFDEERLRAVIGRLSPDNAQGEIYLPDAVERLLGDVDSHGADADEVLGINDRVQLAVAEAVMRRAIVERWMRAGVTMQDPRSVYIGADVELAADVTLLTEVHLEGASSVGTGTVIGPSVRLVDATIGQRCALTYCVVRESEVRDGADVGPYASLRKDTVVGTDAHIGTFVETKKSTIGEGSKVPHLSYVGDATLGDDVNLGANTITCNWDGVDKHPTVVGDGVRTGSGSLLVAPVTLGDDAYTAAGAVVNRDVPPGAMAKGMPAVNEEGWTARNRPPRTSKGASEPGA